MKVNSETTSERRPSSAVDPARQGNKGTSQANALFRAKALEQLDVATEIDNQLPLAPRRTWLVLAGLVLLAAAGVLWAALTPSQTSVNALGRVVAAGGVAQISTMVPGTVAAAPMSSGELITAGQPVFTIMSASGNVDVTSMLSGSVWQLLTQTGAGVESGAVLATVLPDGSSESVLLVVPESQSAGVGEGQRVVIGDSPVGRVAAVSAPLPAAEVTPKVGLPFNSDQLYVIVTVTLDTSLPAGSEVQGRIILTENSVLGRLLGAR